MDYKEVPSERERLAASFRELFPSAAEQREAYAALETLTGVPPSHVYEMLSGIGSGYPTDQQRQQVVRALSYRRAAGAWPAVSRPAGVAR